MIVTVQWFLALKDNPGNEMVWVHQSQLQPLCSVLYFLSRQTWKQVLLSYFSTLSDKYLFLMICWKIIIIIMGEQVKAMHFFRRKFVIPSAPVVSLLGMELSFSLVIEAEYNWYLHSRKRYYNCYHYFQS